MTKYDEYGRSPDYDVHIKTIAEFKVAELIYIKKRISSILTRKAGKNEYATHYQMFKRPNKKVYNLTCENLKLVILNNYVGPFIDEDQKNNFLAKEIDESTFIELLVKIAKLKRLLDE